MHAIFTLQVSLPIFKRHEKERNLQTFERS